MTGRASGALHTSYMSPHETLAAAASRPNSEALVARVVLAHPRMVFHPCTCALRGGAVAIVVALIVYDYVEVAAETSTRRRRL
jgi:hypothetical protein